MLSFSYKVDNLLSTVFHISMPIQPSSTDDAASPDATTELILRIFRANGRLLLAGDQLVAPLGLTSARWQLLGSIAAAEPSQPVAGLARMMGVTRQAVQRITNDLEREGVIAFHPNPHHKRAQLVALTARGRELFEASMALQQPWAAGLAHGMTGLQVATACDALDLLLDRLDAQRDSTDDAVATSAMDRA